MSSDPTKSESRVWSDWSKIGLSNSIQDFNLSEGFVSHIRIIIFWTSFEVPSYHTISRHMSLLSCHDKIFIYNTKHKKIHKFLNKNTSSFYTHHTRPVPKTFPSYSPVANLPHQNFVRSRTKRVKPINF